MEFVSFFFFFHSVCLLTATFLTLSALPLEFSFLILEAFVCSTFALHLPVHVYVSLFLPGIKGFCGGVFFGLLSL